MSASAKGFVMMSGGLDSQLAVRVLQRAGAYVETICFESPFFSADTAVKTAAALGVKLHVIDFTEDILSLIKDPPHGFGGAMNPCIDCHATMIRRAGELMEKSGFDFVATGEVKGQRPMSQNSQALLTVEKTSGLKGRLIRPLSALFLEPTIPEVEGKIDRSLLLDISGRCRDRQIALAKEFGIVDYPSPAGGCKLTEESYSRRLEDLMSHEGFDDRLLLKLLSVGRRFRLESGTSVILGRNGEENELLSSRAKDMPLSQFFVPSREVSGPTALVPRLVASGDDKIVQDLVDAYVKGTTEKDRERFRPLQIL